MPSLHGFVNGSYTLQSVNIEAQRCVNLYPQVDESGSGKNVAALLPTPGLTAFCTLDAVNPVRGMYVTARGRLFAVTRTTLWEINADKTFTNRGTLNSSAGFVGIADNGQVLMLVDGPNGYSFNLTTNVLSAPLANFPGGVTVAFQDGFFIFNPPNANQFYVTKAYSTTVDPTQFASAEGSPDILGALLSDHELLWLFGTNHTEVWYDAGNAIFPFSKVNGGNLPYGLMAQRTPVRFANSVAWLGRGENGRGIVYKSQGLQANRISNHAVEQDIARYPRMDDATGYAYQMDGHEFYVLNFPSGNKTWVYDADTSIWHERAFTGTYGLERQRGDIHVVAFGIHLVSDYATGKIYVLDPLALNDDGTAITRIRATPYVSDELKNVFVRKFQIDAQTGVGADGLPVNPSPKCMLDWSDDGGHTWSNQYWADLGAIGATLSRVIWRRLGRTRQRVFRITVTDDCPLTMVDAFITVSEGQS